MKNTAPVSAGELLHHWQAHRGLTRRVIDAFPEKELFTYTIGGMRPFSEMALEMIRIAEAGITQVASGAYDPEGEWKTRPAPTTKAALLELWDNTTRLIDEQWPQVPAGRFQETEKMFGMYEGTVISLVFYWFDNEIHHRGQGYVYLRALGIEPPPFWDRY